MRKVPVIWATSQSLITHHKLSRELSGTVTGKTVQLITFHGLRLVFVPSPEPWVWSGYWVSVEETGEVGSDSVRKAVTFSSFQRPTEPGSPLLCVCPCVFRLRGVPLPPQPLSCISGLIDWVSAASHSASQTGCRQFDLTPQSLHPSQSASQLAS